MIANLVDKHYDTNEYLSSMCQWMDVEPTHIVFNSIKHNNEHYRNFKQIHIGKDQIINDIDCISRPVLKHDRKLLRHDPKRTGAAIVEILSREGIV